MAALALLLALLGSFLEDPHPLRLAPHDAVTLVVAYRGLGHTQDLGVPIAVRLRQICWRETRCRAWGVHKGDLGGDLDRRSWLGQVRMHEREVVAGRDDRHVDPDCQPFELGPWSTRGSWGLSAAAHWPYLPRCYWPGWLDWTLVSASVALEKYMLECEPEPWDSRPSWCTKKVRRAGPRGA